MTVVWTWSWALLNFMQMTSDNAHLAVKCRAGLDVLSPHSKNNFCHISSSAPEEKTLIEFRQDTKWVPAQFESHTYRRVWLLSQRVKATLLGKTHSNRHDMGRKNVCDIGHKTKTLGYKNRAWITKKLPEFLQPLNWRSSSPPSPCKRVMCVSSCTASLCSGACCPFRGKAAHIYANNCPDKKHPILKVQHCLTLHTQFKLNI